VPQECRYVNKEKAKKQFFGIISSLKKEIHEDNNKYCKNWNFHSMVVNKMPEKIENV